MSGTGPTYDAGHAGRPGRLVQGGRPALAAPYLARPWLGLRPRPGGDPWARTVDPARFQAGLVPGATVLLLDDAWVSGASARPPRWR